jgi:predicted Co/Zn/Cd cation transporter (cation efflux family)
MLLAMDNKSWLVEAEFAACLFAMAVVAFTLMVGHTMWRAMARY